MKIFLSAVSGQFEACRDALRSDLSAVGAEVVVHEDFQQHGASLLEKLERYIASCDRIIALVGDAYREHGAAAFFAPAKKRSGSKLTGEVCQQVQGLLDQGLTVPEVGREVGILSNTLHKAIRAGRLRPGKKDLSNDELASTQ